MPRPLLILPCVFLLATTAPSALGDEKGIIAELRRFLATDDPAQQAAIARNIAADPAFSRGRVTDWLHEAADFPTIKPGTHAIRVSLSHARRTVALRIPADYNPRRPWPLLYALHGTGGTGRSIIGYLDRCLGADIDKWLVAAPSAYEDDLVQAEWPPTREHPLVLNAIKRRVHINSDRVFVVGYSRGGHATWTVATLYADRFAGALPVAGTFILPEVDEFWPDLLPNLRHTPVLAVWGAGDARGPAGTASPEGGIAGMNRALCAVAANLDLPVTCHEYADRGHRDVVPPARELANLLKQRRTRWPRRVSHRFRHPYQARAAWLEGHEWVGPRWRSSLPKLRLRPGEDVRNQDDLRAALHRAYRATLGELSGTIAGQVVEIRRKNIRSLTVWIGEGMIDWDQPVELRVSGRCVFKEQLRPDLLVCLIRARQTLDFERLCWAGIRFESGRATKAVTAETALVGRE